MRHRMLLLLPLLALLLGACVDHRHDPVQPEWTAAAHQVPGAMSLDTIPPRTDDLAGPWEEMVAEELWDHLEAQGGYAILGVKNPGEPRGIWRGTVLTEPAAMTGAENAVGAMAGVDVLRTYEPLPALKVRLSGVDDIVALRSRPFTDYLQPLVIAGAGDGGAAAMSGCRWGDPYTGGAPTTSQGDFIPPGLARMGIRDAWNRNAGEAAVIGIADTGIAPTQDNLDSNFSSGESDTGRWHDIRTVTAGGTDDQCGHGTRVAGLALAPKNGSSIVGAAWKANGVSVRQGNGVHTWLGGGIDAGDAADAILMAVEERYNPLQGGYSERRIVSLAWGARTAHSSVEDAVRFVKGFYGALLLGASGSHVGDVTGAVFPSTMQEVVSVSAVNENRGRVSGIGYGNAVELAAYTDMLGTGEFTSQTRTLQLSSAAVTAMSGIAALVWTQYPNETNHQIRERLQQAAHAYPQRNTTYGFGVVNATKAVGGMYNAWASRSLVSGGGFSEPATYDLTAHWSGGDGPFQFYWGTGHTTRTIRVTINPGDNPQTYSVWTTDSSDGTQRMASIAVDPPPGGCADPTVIIC